MRRKHTNFIVSFFLLLVTTALHGQQQNSKFVSFVTEPSSVKLYWKDDQGQILGSLQNLKQFVETRNEELKFAVNGGMYTKDRSPQGLFIENNITITPLDTLSGTGNFYLMPNGVFYVTSEGKAVVAQTKDFVNDGGIKFATQSGPMLLIDGQIHHAFKQGSPNVNIRNGVGILPDNRVVFIMSKQALNFYDFADFFKSMGCRNALYLDGFVSRTYLPDENWKQLDGDFGVIIGVTQ